MSPFVLTPAKLRFCQDIAKLPRQLVVWWYGPLVKNPRLVSVPKITVFFRELCKDGSFGSFVRYNTLLTNLGILRIGTIWEQGQIKGVLNYTTEQFGISFKFGDWKIYSLYQYTKKRNVYCPIPLDKYKLPHRNDKNFLLHWDLGDNKYLVIPCVEFFMRMFGRSTEIKRVLATYPWSEVQKRLFSYGCDVGRDGWVVQIPRDLKKDDVPFLAHVYYNPYSTKVAKSIYSQLESAYSKNTTQVFLKSCPWHQENVKLKVDGVWVNEKTFLGVRIRGASDPDGPEISYISLENSAEQALEAGTNKNGAKPMIRILTTPPMDVNISEEKEPDRGAEVIEIEEDEFEVLGTPRGIRKVAVSKSENVEDAYKSKFVDPSEQCESFSPGEVYSSKKGVGRLVQHSPAVIESSGLLMEMWNAARALQKSHSDKIYSVDWFTFEDGFCSDSVPKLISLNSQNSGNNLDPTSVRWSYLDLEKGQVRGMLIMRLITKSKHVYIAEIQRRICYNDIEDIFKDANEYFKGLVFTLKDNSTASRWISEIVDEIINVEGTIYNFKLSIDGNINSFKHFPGKGNAFSYESCIKNALKKCSVKL